MWRRRSYLHLHSPSLPADAQCIPSSTRAWTGASGYRAQAGAILLMLIKTAKPEGTRRVGLQSWPAAHVPSPPPPACLLVPSVHFRVHHRRRCRTMNAATRHCTPPPHHTTERRCTMPRPSCPRTPATIPPNAAKPCSGGCRLLLLIPMCSRVCPCVSVRARGGMADATPPRTVAACRAAVGRRAVGRRAVGRRSGGAAVRWGGGPVGRRDVARGMVRGGVPATAWRRAVRRVRRGGVRCDGVRCEGVACKTWSG